MGQGADQVTTPDDIAATRENLSRDLDELTDKVSPARVVERQKQAARSRISSVRDKVMGAAHDSRDSVAGSASDAGSAVTGRASDAAGSISSAAQGNPLAAGLVAFGAGLVIATLIPASSREERIAREAVDAAQPLVEEARSVGRDLGQDLQQSAADSAHEVQDAAQEAIGTLQQEGRQSAEHVKDRASDA